MIEHMFETSSFETLPPPDLQGWDVEIPDPWRGDDARSTVVPEGLEDWVPDMRLASYLARIDRSRIAGYDLVRVLQAETRLISHFQANSYRTKAEIASLPELNGPETAASEIAAALQLTRQTAWSETEFATNLIGHPRILEALSSGSIDLRRTRVIVNGLNGVDSNTVNKALDRVLPGASEHTTGQIAAQLRRVIIASNPQQAKATFEAALEDRKLVIYENPDGTANFLATNLPPDRLNAIRQRIEELSRTLKTADDPRTADQLRADTFLDLLEDRVTGGQGRAFVNIDIDLTTLMGLDDNPAHIPGYGPILAELGRKVVLDQVDCDWEFTVRDQGRPIATGTLSRRPTV